MPLTTDAFRPLLAVGASPHDWAAAMSLALQDSAFANTWSQDAGSACRAVFVFDNGLRLSWVGDGCEGEPEFAQVWHQDGSAEQPCAPISDAGLYWDGETCSWIGDISTPSDLVALVDRLVAEYGRCTVVLPWEPFVRTEGPEAVLEGLSGEGDFLEQVARLSDEQVEDVLAGGDIQEDEDPGFALALAALERGTLCVPSEWSASPAVCVGGDDYLIPGSPLDRFYRFVEAMEEKPDWIVIWNECCGTCAGSSYQAMRETKNLPDGAPSLVLFGQNAQYSWRPDCTVSVEFYMGSSEETQVVMEEARRVGLQPAVRGDDNVVVLDT